MTVLGRQILWMLGWVVLGVIIYLSVMQVLELIVSLISV
jgi:hypothetical protein